MMGILVVNQGCQHVGSDMAPADYAVGARGLDYLGRRQLLITFLTQNGYYGPFHPQPLRLHAQYAGLVLADYIIIIKVDSFGIYSPLLDRQAIGVILLGAFAVPFCFSLLTALPGRCIHFFCGRFKSLGRFKSGLFIKLLKQ